MLEQKEGHTLRKIKELPIDLAENFDLPINVMPGIGTVTVVGARQARIEGHRGILEYSQERLVVLLKKGKLSISGAGLHLQAMNNDELIAAGRIDSVEWA